MSKRKFRLASAIAAGSAVGIPSLAMASTTVTPVLSTNITTWLGTPTYTTLAPTAATTAQAGLEVASNATSYALVETFTATAADNQVAAIGMLVGIPATAGTLSAHIYDVTSAISSGNGTTTQGSGATYAPITSGSTDVLGGSVGSAPPPGTLGSGGPVTPGTATFTASTAGGEDQLDLVLGSPITLTVGDIYAVEIWASTTSTNNFIWYRGGAVATDGEMMSAADATGTGNTASPVSTYTDEDSRVTIASAGGAGGAPRTAALALYSSSPIPEPASATILGLGSLAFLSRRKSKID